MATGLEAAAGAAQIISLAFQIFQSCIEAYKFCHTAQLIGPDGDLLRTKLQMERYRLEEWSRCSRLNTSSPDDRLNWPLIYSILEQQHAILTSAEKLRVKYGLILPEVKVGGSEDGDGAGDGDESQKENSSSSRGLDRVFRVLRPKLYANSSSSSSSRAIAAGNGPWKRLQWAAVGRERVVQVIDDLGELNTHLERLLDSPDRKWLKSGMSALLRDALSHTTELADVETLQALLRPSSGVGDTAIASAAKFKRIRLVLGVDQRPDEIRAPQTPAIFGSMPRLKMLREKRLKTDHADMQNSGSTHLATYSSEPVLVEWRVTTTAKYAVLHNRMQSLALLLGNVDNTFASLPCLGLIASEGRSRFALVYEIPALAEAIVGEQHLVATRQLHELIDTRRQTSLKARLKIACTLAEAVLQLHTAGWLHKSIRSDNVRFLGSSPGDAGTFLEGRPYLMGYDYARPESDSAFTELPDAPLYTDLYRHPDKRGPTSTGYRKRFDLYSLGCVLIELALWEQLVSVISRLTGEDWRGKIEDAEYTKKDLKLPSLLDVVGNPAFIKEVCHAVGPRYLEAVELCFRGNTSNGGNDEASLDIQRAIVEKLHTVDV